MINYIFAGGLGNQMFEYAFLYSQMQKNPELRSEIRLWMHHEAIYDRREYELNNFNISVQNQVDDVESMPHTLFKQYERYDIICKIPFHLRISEGQRIRLMEKIGALMLYRTPHTYFPKLQITEGCKFVQGFFQNASFFIDYREDLIREFEIKKEMSVNAQILSKQMQESNSVALHVRRGDYVNNPAAISYRVCNYEYYKRGMEYIDRRIEKPVFYVFSNSHNDHEWIMQNFNFKDFNIVHVDLQIPDYEELILMSRCKHFIISNSSYSWWGQFLAKSIDKIVIAPKHWTVDGVETEEDGVFMNYMVRI